MTPEQWQRARELFETALEVPAGDTDVWLRGHEETPEIVAEVRSLLNHHTRAGAFLEGAITDRAPHLLADEARFESGATVGAYIIKREIGRGGMGRVYLATDTRLERDVALKVLPPQLVRHPAQRERLRREARAAAALNHPAICTVYALEEIGEDVVLTTEYIDGHTMREEIAAGRRPDPTELLRTAQALISALEAAHARGITHRDLKPENVMRTSDGRVKILDFGLALMSSGEAEWPSARVTTPGTLVGTPAYMAPEQLNGGAVDARTDLFAFGVMLYELAGGIHPFDANSPLATIARILESDPHPLVQVMPGVPPVVAAAVDRCLQKEPNARFESAGEVASLLASAGASARADSGGSQWWRTHQLVITALYFAGATAGWFVKELDHGFADAGFILLGMLSVIGGIVRGHLLFAERAHARAMFRLELKRRTPLMVAVDVTMGSALMVEGLLLARVRPVTGVLVIGLGVGIALTRLVVERTTTYSAFGEP